MIFDSKKAYNVAELLLNLEAIPICFSQDFLVVYTHSEKIQQFKINLSDRLILGIFLSKLGSVQIRNTKTNSWQGYTPNILCMEPGQYEVEVTATKAETTVFIFMQRSYFETLVDNPTVVLTKNSYHYAISQHDTYGAWSYVSVRSNRLVHKYMPRGTAYLQQKRDVLELLIASLANIENGQSSLLKPSDAERMHIVRKIIESRYAENLTIASLAREAGTNEQYLKVHFKKLFGNTIYRTLLDCRMRSAKKLLMELEGRKISEVAELTGYKHATHFTTAFKKYFGYKPTKLR